MLEGRVVAAWCLRDYWRTFGSKLDTHEHSFHARCKVYYLCMAHASGGSLV